MSGVVLANIPSLYLNKCKYILWRKEKTLIFLVLGDTGSGKSNVGLLLGMGLDKTFNKDTIPERTIYTMTEFMKLQEKLKPGQAILWDEIAGNEEGADSRRSMSRGNLDLGQFTTSMRARQLILIYCSPTEDQVDKRIRAIGVTAKIKCYDSDRFKRRVEAKWIWTKFGWKYGFMQRIRDSFGRRRALSLIRFPYVDADTWKVYSDVKEKYMMTQSKRLAKRYSIAEMKRMPITEVYELVKRDLDKYRNLDGVVSTKLIRAYTELPATKVSLLASLFEAEGIEVVGSKTKKK